ncbi:MAG: hypothetical protein HKN46_01205 [Acidimicrobiia bacterium]|nr:hypothetical protein [Acidimicrobiia bacterium]
MPDGPTTFARFAYPPNELGLCGPDDGELIGAVAEGAPNAEIHQALRGFTGAYPYLRFISEQRGVGDPLAADVVESYWLAHGSEASADLLDFGNHLRETFLPRMGSDWMGFTSQLESMPHPTHAFHVLAVYPWLGKLREGMVEPSLRILDRCRVRWGRIESVDGLSATASSSPLTWEDGTLSLGDPVVEEVRLYAGLGAVAGDAVALHWDWACAVLDDPRLTSLRNDTHRVLAAANTGNLVEP